jgi:hypothetical protein
MQGTTIDPGSFRHAYNEYRLARRALQHQAMLVRVLECPACGPEPHAVHIDGNHKLFVWDRKQGHYRQATDAEVLYYKDAEVLAQLDYLDLALGSNHQVSVCMHLLVCNVQGPLLLINPCTYFCRWMLGAMGCGGL